MTFGLRHARMTEEAGGFRKKPNSALRWRLSVKGSSEASFMALEKAVAQRFAGDLAELRQRAGRPSYSTLERLSGHELRRTTMSDVLNGNRVNLPEWRFVSAFVAACRGAAEESGLEANDLGTIADWKRHWDGASSGFIDARFPGHEHQPFARQELVLTPADEHPTMPLPPDQPLGAAGAATGDTTGDIEHAGTPVWGPVPPRLPDFAGREAWLARLHDALARPDHASPVVIQGLCGTGKTQLAVEYAHRYRREYDLVWWISCADQDSAQLAMTDLAARLGSADVPAEEGEARYANLFDRLRGGEPRERWLLVFDSASEPDLVRPLIPPTRDSGHVLVTSRNSRWEATADMHELDAFTREESIEFLRRRLRRFNAADAHRLADAVGDLPLVLEHAIELQIAIADYVARLADDPLALLDSQPSDYPATIAGEWQAAITRLRDQAPDAFALLRCLSYFGSEPIPREALERGSYLSNVSLHALLRDSIRCNRAIMMLRRAGLLRVHADSRTLEVHPVTRWIVRAMDTRAEAADAGRSRHDVHLLVAAADTLRPDDPCDCRAYEELRTHALQSDAEACPEESVRRLVVNLVRSLTSAGDPRTAASLADRAMRRWREDTTAGRESDPGGFLAMSQAKAEALLSCGQYQAAFQLRDETLAAMRVDSFRWEPEIIQMGWMTGARYRITGDFSAALAADQESADGHIAEFGRDDPRTFAAVNSLITDLTLNGQYSDAARTAAQLSYDCLGFYNEADYPSVLFERNVLGRCCWLDGRYEEALSIMAEVHDGYAMVTGSGVLAADHPWRLTHEIDYALTRRDKGSTAADLEAIAADLHEVRRQRWRTFGVDHPETLAATVVLASILKRIDGRAGEALRMLAEAVSRYQSLLPRHPFTLACHGYLASLRWQAATSESERSALDCASDLTDVIARLTMTVGRSHPLSLTTMASLANVLAEAGDLDTAASHAEQALTAFHDRLGPNHPHSLACKVNLATIRAWQGEQTGSGEARARYAVAVGSEHPDVRLLDEDRLVYPDFTPLPL
jgi:tetratricopeptide (TPR) repeat protein